MWLNDKSQKLEGSILRDKLKLDVMSVECAVDIHGLLIARIRIQSKRRSNEILKFIMGEEALKATKQPAAMKVPILDYNLCVPSDGHKIKGVDGIQIFPNSKDTKFEFEMFSAMIDDIKDNSLRIAGQYLGKWEHNGPTAQHECKIVQETYLHSDIQKLACKKHPLLVDQLFDPETLRQIEEWDQAEQRLKDAEEDDEFEPGHEGTVYWAETPFLPGLLKNGGSRYDGATRVRQLYTAGVPLPYVLRYEKTFNDWKLYEGVIHEYFKAARVYERKEFFSYSLEDAIKLTNQIDGLEAFSDDEKVRWDRAMLKISKRLSKNRAAWARKKAKALSETQPDDRFKALTDETVYLKQELEKYQTLLQILTSERDQA